MDVLDEDFSHLWQYLAEFSFEWEMFQIKVLENTEIRVLHLVTSPPPKIVPFMR
jgi:hypothetical protein